nr:glycosyltransferase family 87 protein [Calditrichia bacterium]
MSDLFRYIFQDAYLAKFMLPDAARERLDRLDPRWWVASAQLIAFLGGVALLSPLFNPVPASLQPFGWLIGLLMSAGIVFLGVGELLRFFPPRRSLMLLILATGLAMRLIMSWAPPVLEVDYQRYLWDGAVIASGENPYRLPPDDIAGQPDPRLQALYRQSQGLPDRINHGHLTTVYPPLAQAFFALAYQIRPFSLGAWKAILYLADLITLLLIFAILKRLGRSPTWAALYWLNPLLIKEMFNSAHMDLLVFPFLMAAILWAISDRHLLAMVFLSAATAVKLWPVILAPIFLKMLWPRWRQLLTATAVFGLLTLTLLAPMLLTGLGSGSGLATYGETWHNNDSLHKL